MYIKYEIDKSDELLNHLMKNGYDYVFDNVNNWLFVYEDEKDYVEIIMKEHNVDYRKEEV